jgi:hypothetical protein
MQDYDHQVIRRRLEMVLIAFFVGCVLFIVVVYVVDPSIITQGLMLKPSPTERYPLVATVFMLALLAWIGVGIVGVLRHWRWLFWLLLVAFGASVLQVPATILELVGVVPNPFPVPVWYSLSRMGVAVVEVGIAVWMVWIYRVYGVWAMGKKRPVSE